MSYSKAFSIFHVIFPLWLDGVELKDLAEEYDTPLYVYDLNRMVDNYNLYIGSLKLIKSFLLCYAVKANSNLTILNAFSQLGAGFDVVSGGEIVRCLTAGVDPNKIVFSGCGKSDKELELAVSSGIHCINVESWEELDRLEVVALKLNKIQNISIRINPGIALEGLSHSNILTGSQGNKFGVPIGEALDIYNRAKASPSLKIKGISCHLGSNINQLDPFIEARDKLLDLADELRTELKICVEHINLGGGFGAQIESNLHTPDIPQWVEKLGKPISERGLRLILEPGRSLVADAGVLLTKVEYIKTAHKGSTVTTPPRSGSILGSHHEKKPHHETPKTIAIVDAGFNDYMRTALYGYQPNIVPTVIKHHDLPGFTSEFKYDIVGPVCETTDTFYKGFTTNQKLEVGDYLIFTDVGAYGKFRGTTLHVIRSQCLLRSPIFRCIYGQ